MNLAAANGPSSIIVGLAVLVTLGAIVVSFVWNTIKLTFRKSSHEREFNNRNREQW